MGLARGDEPVGDAERVDETAACRLDAKCRAAPNAEPFLQQATNVRKYDIRRGRAHNDKVDITRLHVGRVERLPRCLLCEIRRRLAIGRDMAALDTRARANPLIGRVDHLLQIVVGQHPFG